MRPLWVTALAGSIMALAGWGNGTAVAVPRTCTPADARERAFLVTGDRSRERDYPYTRACGAASAVVRVGGATYVLKGGSCGYRDARTRWLWFGLFTGGNRPGASAEGLSLVLQPANRDGRTTLADSVVEVGGLNLAPRDIAVQRDGLRRGTFSGIWQGTRVTGGWVCNDSAFGAITFHRLR